MEVPELQANSMWEDTKLYDLIMQTLGEPPLAFITRPC